MAFPKEGIQHGDRVAYLVLIITECERDITGVVQARAIVMPLNVRLSQLELTNILNRIQGRGC